MVASELEHGSLRSFALDPTDPAARQRRQSLFWSRLGSQKPPALLACAAVGASFALAAYIFWQLPPAGIFRDTVYTWMDSGAFQVNLFLSGRRAQRRDAADRHRYRLSDSPLFPRLYGATTKARCAFSSFSIFYFFHARAGHGRQLVAALRRLGRRRSVFLSIDRFLVSGRRTIPSPATRRSSSIALAISVLSWAFFCWSRNWAGKASGRLILPNCNSMRDCSVRRSSV